MKNEHLDLFINLGLMGVILLTTVAAVLPSKPELQLEDMFDAYARGFALGFADGRDSVAVAVES